jgi:hypothetical protein
MTYKAHPTPAGLGFTQDAGHTMVTVESLSRGDIFMREGALCMRVEFHDYHGVIGQVGELIRADNRKFVLIVNLKTGRAWPVDAGSFVTCVRATVSIEVE